MSKKAERPKNIILMIGDGMSNGYISMYRHFKQQRPTNQPELVAFEPYFQGQAMTHCYQEDPELLIITDSAAAGTALATGHKTKNGYVGVTPDGEYLDSIINLTKAQGRATGVVVTDVLTGGTPSAFLSHNYSRTQQEDLANDMIDERIGGQIKADVLMGGGSIYFEREDRDLSQEFIDEGYDYVVTLDDLKAANGDRVLGLFARNGLFPLIDHPDTQPVLADMVASAIERLSRNQEGFFLMVEGSQIDWGGHYGDPCYVMSEMEGFEQAFEIVRDFAENDGETLVIVTADHETGGLTLGAGGQFNPSYLKGMKKTSIFIANEIIASQEINQTLSKYVEWPFTSAEIAAIETAMLPPGDGFTEICDILAAAVSRRAQVGWGSRSHSDSVLSHSGEDVNVYALGPGHERFRGIYNNTHIGQTIIEMTTTKN